LKRAFIHYLRIATGFYGNFFTSAELLPFHITNNISQSTPSDIMNNNSTNEYENPMLSKQKEMIKNKKTLSIHQTYHALYSTSWEELKDYPTSSILVTLSTNMLVFLDPDNWEVRMSTPLWDIQNYRIIPSKYYNLSISVYIYNIMIYNHCFIFILY